MSLSKVRGLLGADRYHDVGTAALHAGQLCDSESQRSAGSHSSQDFAPHGRGRAVQRCGARAPRATCPSSAMSDSGFPSSGGGGFLGNIVFKKVAQQDESVKQLAEELRQLKEMNGELRKEVAELKAAQNESKTEMQKSVAAFSQALQASQEQTRLEHRRQLEQIMSALVPSSRGGLNEQATAETQERSLPPVSEAPANSNSLLARRRSRIGALGGASHLAAEAPTSTHAPPSTLSIYELGMEPEPSRKKMRVASPDESRLSQSSGAPVHSASPPKVVRSLDIFDAEDRQDDETSAMADTNKDAAATSRGTSNCCTATRVSGLVDNAAESRAVDGETICLASPASTLSVLGSIGSCPTTGSSPGADPSPQQPVPKAFNVVGSQRSTAASSSSACSKRHYSTLINERGIGSFYAATKPVRAAYLRATGAAARADDSSSG